MCKSHRTVADRRQHSGMFSGVQTENGRPGGFLCISELSSCHCLTHQCIAFEDGASCWFSSWWNLCWISVMDPIRIKFHSTHTRSTQWCWWRFKYSGMFCCVDNTHVLKEHCVIMFVVCWILMIMALCFLVTSATTYLLTWHNVPDDPNLKFSSFISVLQ
jgi:hypothetical protein